MSVREFTVIDSRKEKNKQLAKRQQIMDRLLAAFDNPRCSQIDKRKIARNVCKKALEYILEERFNEARIYYDAALRINSDCYEAHTGMLHVLYSTLDESQPGFEKKFEYHFDKAIQIKPFETSAYNFKGLYLMHIQQYNRAIKYFTHVTTLDPNNRAAYCNIGVSYYKMGCVKESIPFFNKSIDIIFNNSNHTRNKHTDRAAAAAYANIGIAECRLAINNNDIEGFLRAKRSLFKALRLGFKHVKVYNTLGKAYEREENYNAALKCYLRSCDCDPTNYYANLRIGEIMKAAKRYENAEKYLAAACNAAQDQDEYNHAVKVYYEVRKKQKM